MWRSKGFALCATAMTCGTLRCAWLLAGNSLTALHQDAVEQNSGTRGTCPWTRHSQLPNRPLDRQSGALLALSEREDHRLPQRVPAGSAEVHLSASLYKRRTSEQGLGVSVFYLHKQSICRITWVLSFGCHIQKSLNLQRGTLIWGFPNSATKNNTRTSS